MLSFFTSTQQPNETAQMQQPTANKQMGTRHPLEIAADVTDIRTLQPSLLRVMQLPPETGRSLSDSVEEGISSRTV
jgi:hypothetical protein